MRKLLLLTGLFASAIALGQGSPDYAGGLKVNINEDGSKYFRIISWAQVWAQYNGDKPLDANGNEQSEIDFSVRRARVLLYSQISPKFLIVTHFGLNSLRRTFFPERASNIISIQAVYPGASPEEIEEGVILKIEDNLESLAGIERITSVSTENLGTVTIEVSSDYKTETILQDVKNEVDRINSFPDGMEPPAVYIFEPPQSAINLALTGNMELKELKKCLSPL